MTTLRVRGWDKWQSYRKDRGQPPWIKVHRDLMRRPTWVQLTDAQRGQLVAMWMLAADQDGDIPASPAMIRKLCFMDSEPDINLFVSFEFLEWRQDDARATPERRQSDAPETETETETEKITAIAVLPTILKTGEPLEIEKPVTGPPVLASPEVPKEQPGKYAFEAGVIRLKERDLKLWTESFSHLDLRAELIALAAWAETQPKWFHAVSGALAKRNRQQKAEHARAGPGGIRRHYPEDPMAGIV